MRLRGCARLTYPKFVSAARLASRTCGTGGSTPACCDGTDIAQRHQIWGEPEELIK